MIETPHEGNPEKNNTVFLSPTEQLMIINDTAKWFEVTDREKPDMIYFLDKSARPLSWLLRRFCKNKHKDLPQIRFLNIGSEKDEKFENDIDYSDFPELSASKKYHPAKVMVVDEKSHSGKSLRIASAVIRRLYGIRQEQVVPYSVLSQFPSWYGRSDMISVTDLDETNTNLLSQLAKDQSAFSGFRKEIDQLVSKMEKYEQRTYEFREIESEIESLSFDDPTNYKPPLDIPLIRRGYMFTCDVTSMKKVADSLMSNTIDLAEGMRLYYLIKYNRVRPEDSWNYNVLDFASPSLNCLAESILHQLSP